MMSFRFFFFFNLVRLALCQLGNLIFLASRRAARRGDPNKNMQWYTLIKSVITHLNCRKKNKTARRTDGRREESCLAAESAFGINFKTFERP